VAIIMLLIALLLVAEVEEVAATMERERVEQTGGEITLVQSRRGSSISI